MKLTELTQNQTAIVEQLAGSAELVLRLAELGFTTGESIRIVGRSLFKSPIYVEVRGALMALRKNEAECIQVRV